MCQVLDEASPVRRLTTAGTQSSVDGEDDPGDEPRVGAGQKGDNVGDLGRLGGPTHGYATQKLRHIIGRDVRGRVGGGERRSDGVDPHPLRGPTRLPVNESG